MFCVLYCRLLQEVARTNGLPDDMLAASNLPGQLARLSPRQEEELRREVGRTQLSSHHCNVPSVLQYIVAWYGTC